MSESSQSTLTSSTTSLSIPVITIDGPGASGKGIISKMLAKKLGWHLLPSGSIYRVLAFRVLDLNLSLDNEEKIVELALNLPVEFVGDDVLLAGKIITNLLGTEKVGNPASIIAAIPRVREALLERQRMFLEAPGLVAEGRDMGTVVFKTANLKIFLDASALVRAKRRYNQLKNLGYDVNLSELEKEVKLRDTRDRNRAVAPLVPAEDAVIIDTTELDINGVLQEVLNLVKSKNLS